MELLKKQIFICILGVSIIALLLSLLVIQGGFSADKLLWDKIETACGCDVSKLGGNIIQDEKIAYFEGREVEIPELAFSNISENVLGMASEEKWVEVDLSDQKLYAWEGDKLFLETLVSTGLPWYPTPTGEFNVWIKLRATKMSGGSGSTYYYLPNVPYVMFFGNDQVPDWKGYALHGAYWHNDFGIQKSHGCVNLPVEVAGQIYNWAGPVMPEGKNVVYSSSDNPGLRIVIHE